MNNNEEEGSGKRNLTPLILGAILALFPAAAYLIGISFYQGNLSAFGVSDSQFPISTQYVYLQAYYAIGDLLLTLVTKLVSFVRESQPCYLFSAFLIIIAVNYFLLWTSQKRIFFRCFEYLSKINLTFPWTHWINNNLTKSLGIIVAAIYIIAVFIYLFLLIAIVWWLFCLPFYSAGKDKASARIKTFQEKGCQADPKTKWDTCYVVVDDKGNTLHEGLLLKMNDNEIAMFKKDGTYTFARQKDWLIRRKLHKTL